MKPVVICHPERPRKELEAVNALFAAGLEIFHLRKPGWTEEELRAWIEGVDTQYRNRLMVHSHLGLAEELNLRGVHFTTYNRHLMEDYLKTSVPKSIAVHSMEELTYLDDAFSYAFLSPVFESISKAGYGPQIDHGELKEFLKTFNKLQVLALGGIDGDNIDIAKDLGFDSVALHGALWVQFAKDAKVDALVTKYKSIAEKW